MGPARGRRVHRRRAGAPLVAVTILALTGCASLGAGGGADAGDGPSGPDASPSAPGADDGADDAAPVLQVAHVGGFVPVGWDFANVPEVSLWADGMAIALGPTTLEYPGHLLPNLRTHDVGADEVAELLEAARAAGLDVETDYGTPPVADAGATEVRLVLDGRTVVHRAEALDVAGLEGEATTSGLGEQEVAAREVLTDYLEQVHSTIGAAEDLGPYEPQSFAVMARPVEDAAGASPDPDVAPATLTWPLEEPLTAGTCTVVDGEDAARLAPVLAQARQGDLFEQDGVPHEVWVRVLLPGEAGCAGDERVPTG